MQATWCKQSVGEEWNSRGGLVSLGRGNHVFRHVEDGAVCFLQKDMETRMFCCWSVLG